MLWIAVEGETAGRACTLGKTLLEFGPQGNALAERAIDHLARAEGRFASLFETARENKQLDPCYDPARLFRSDLLGLRPSTEGPDVDAYTLAREITNDLDALVMSDRNVATLLMTRSSALPSASTLAGAVTVARGPYV